MESIKYLSKRKQIEDIKKEKFSISFDLNSHVNKNTEDIFSSMDNIKKFICEPEKFSIGHNVYESDMMIDRHKLYSSYRILFKEGLMDLIESKNKDGIVQLLIDKGLLFNIYQSTNTDTENNDETPKPEPRSAVAALGVVVAAYWGVVAAALGITVTYLVNRTGNWTKGRSSFEPLSQFYQKYYPLTSNEELSRIFYIIETYDKNLAFEVDSLVSEYMITKQTCNNLISEF